MNCSRWSSFELIRSCELDSGIDWKYEDDRHNNSYLYDPVYDKVMWNSWFQTYL